MTYANPFEHWTRCPACNPLLPKGTPPMTADHPEMGQPEPLPTVPLAGRCYDLEITAEERAAINNDGVCLSLLYYFRTRDLTQRRPGGFVTYCLTNDFLGAMNNRGVSWEAVDAIRKILNRCPSFAFGSVDNFARWTRPRSTWEIESAEQFSGGRR